MLPHDDPFAIAALSEENFRQQIEILASCFRVASLEQVVDEIKHECLLPETICITFDDGYLDNYIYAYPILKQYNVPATIFLTSDVIGTTKILWHDRALLALKNTQNRRFHHEDFSKQEFDLTDELSKQHVAIRILEWLKRFSPVERDNKIKTLLDLCGVKESIGGPRLMLDWQEVQEMHRNGITFGAHTKSHPILTLLPQEEKEGEIIGSKRAIEDKLGVAVTTFAYPNGKITDFDEETKRCLRLAGFRCAVTTCFGLNTSKRDAFEFYREQPWETQPDRFFARLLWTRLTGH